MVEKVLPIQCGEKGCGETIFEYVSAPEYPHGAIRVIERHRGQKHTTTIPLHVALSLGLSEQIDTSKAANTSMVEASSML